MNTNEKTWYVMNPIPIEMEDAITHTDENGYECEDPECICHDEQTGRNAAQDRNMTTQLPDGSWW